MSEIEKSNIVKTNKEKGNKIIERISKPNFINMVLNILVILSILSIWLGIYFFDISSNNTNANFFISQTWRMIFAIPIPICSLIAGIIFYKRGFECKKNIVVGVAVSIILLLFSSISILDMSSYIDYNEINKYKHIISIDLPSEGKYKRIEWDSSYLENNISNYIQFTNNYGADKFLNDIQNSDKWLSNIQINTNYKEMLPPYFEGTSDTYYYLVYNNDTNEYNTKPKETGKYKYYAMMYDPDCKSLNIEEYMYNYKK